MRTWLKAIRLVWSLIVLCCVAVACSNDDLDDAKMVIKMLESFRVRNGTLPQSLDQLGERVSSSIYYERRDDNYIVWYGARLGESRVYRSELKSWRDED